MDRLEFFDWVKGTVIVAMFSDDRLMEKLVLKGGNLLDLVWQIAARASFDVDFSIRGDFEDIEDLRRRVERVLSSAFDEGGFVVFDVTLTSVPPHISDDMKHFWGGYKIFFKIISKSRFIEFDGDLNSLRRNSEEVAPGHARKFEIDLSKHEFCDDQREYEFSHFLVIGQSPAMFVAEKLRAICQQMEEYTKEVKKHSALRARDFVDIYVACEHFHLSFSTSEFRDVLRKTFEAKKVPLQLLKKLEEVREVHRDDFQSVRDNVKPNFPLKDYDFYVDYSISRCRELESLWDV